jgi:hypothetical protein
MLLDLLLVVFSDMEMLSGLREGLVDGGINAFTV